MPGGPQRRTPLGTRAPERRKRSGFRKKSTTSSSSTCRVAILLNFQKTHSMFTQQASGRPAACLQSCSYLTTFTLLHQDTAQRML